MIYLNHPLTFLHSTRSLILSQQYFKITVIWSKILLFAPSLRMRGCAVCERWMRTMWEWKSACFATPHCTALLNYMYMCVYCDIVSNPSFWTFTCNEALYSVNSSYSLCCSGSISARRRCVHYENVHHFPKLWPARWSLVRARNSPQHFLRLCSHNFHDRLTWASFQILYHIYTDYQ